MRHVQLREAASGEVVTRGTVDWEYAPKVILWDERVWTWVGRRYVGTVAEEYLETPAARLVAERA